MTTIHLTPIHSSYKACLLPREIKGKLFFGPQPWNYIGETVQDNVLLDLRDKEKVSVLWNLCAETPWTLLEYESWLFEVFHSKIEDYVTPQNSDSFKNDLECIFLRLIEGKNVFIHCLAGRGRTGMALSLLLTKIIIHAAGNKPNIEEILNIVKKLCGGPETEDQKKFVRNFKF